MSEALWEDEERRRRARLRFYLCGIALCAAALVSLPSLGWWLRSQDAEFAVAVELSRLGGALKQAHPRPLGTDPWGNVWHAEVTGGTAGAGIAGAPRVSLSSSVELYRSLGPDGEDQAGAGDDLVLDLGFEERHALGKPGLAGGWALALDGLKYGGLALLWLLAWVDLKTPLRRLARELAGLGLPVTGACLLTLPLCMEASKAAGYSLWKEVGRQSLAPQPLALLLGVGLSFTLAFLVPRLWIMGPRVPEEPQPEEPQP